MRSIKFVTRTLGLAAAAAIALTGCSSDNGDTDAGSSVSVDSDQSQSASSSGTPTEQSSASQTGSDSSGQDEDQQSTPRDADLRQVDFAVTAQDALDTSAQEVGSEGIVHAIELDYSSHYDAWKWSVKTLVSGTDHEVEIDADTGKVLESEKESTDDTEKAIDLDQPMKQQEAQKLALEKVEGPVRGWKLEWDDGVRAYEFDIGDGQGDETEVTINVENGNVTVDD